MIGINYNIADLFKEAFGIGGLAVYNIPMDKEQGGVQLDFTGLDVVQPISAPQRMSHLGTPILFPITFKGKKYKVFNDQGDVVLKDFEDFELPAVTLTSFRRAKIMSKTNTLGSNGTVKEMYSFSDWAIDIRGICLRDPKQPQKLFEANDQKIRIAEMEEIVDSIRVYGALFTDINIDDIVIEELSFSQLKGRPGTIPFYMRCSSDQPIELIL